MSINAFILTSHNSQRALVDKMRLDVEPRQENEGNPQTIGPIEAARQGLLNPGTKKKITKQKCNFSEIFVE